MLSMLALAIVLGAASPSADQPRIVEETIALNVPSTTLYIHGSEEQAMLDDVNAGRKREGLAPLVIDDKLTVLARQHGKDMLTRHYFGHVTPDGVSPFDRMHAAGYHYQYAGENIAFSDSEANAARGLWASVDHRDNMLGGHYRKIGIGAVGTGVYGNVYVQEFSD